MKRNGKQTGCISAQPGFTYLSLLFFVALVGPGLSALGLVWHLEAQRQKEAELLFVVDEFRPAILLYYERSPGGAKRYPQTLEDLLEDKRYPTMQRYLRRIYPGPMTGEANWEVVLAPEGGIRGVRSRSERKPIKQTGFPQRLASFVNAQSYSGWIFVAETTTGAGTSIVTPTGGPQSGLVSTSAGGAGETRVPAPRASAGAPPERRAQCDALSRTGRVLCDIVRERHGQETAQACLASSDQRHAGCLDPSGASMVPLVVGPR